MARRTLRRRVVDEDVAALDGEGEGVERLENIKPAIAREYVEIRKQGVSVERPSGQPTVVHGEDELGFLVVGCSVSWDKPDRGILPDDGEAGDGSLGRFDRW